ncbi:Very-long-chain 3-ketoacyl-CoA synthase [Trema orientale]|uniref:3-ketoacyl-CoA synthase n=1 Tax=Trema orientale TaxID=63057 RepID=A0A2P5BRB1_TREOI|nr:Very-long-chain 3-ketoacyl-CoA synthase [Trema orientale]
MGNEKLVQNLKNKPTSVKIKYVKLGFHYLISNIVYLFLVPLIVALAHLSIEDIVQLCQRFKLGQVSSSFLCTTAVLILCLTKIYFSRRPRDVYLLDFACFKPEPFLICTRETFMRQIGRANFSDELLGFHKKIIERSGYGQKTYVPKAALEDQPVATMAKAREEVEMLVFGAIDGLLAKTGVNVKDIGILVVNCSLFNPTPSLSAMVVNRYKLRGNILSYNLGGMGCSAGLISVDLAKRLLQDEPNTYALVVSTESMTLNWYGGTNKSMLLTNCLFRLGASAVLLTNKSSERRRSKYKIMHTLRTHKGADNESFQCVMQQEDHAGEVGVKLSKDLLTVAGDAIKTNVTMLGPLVLPLSEQILFLANLAGSKIFRMKIQPYVPDFKLAFEHICIHAGGRAVLDEIEKNLNLTKWHMEPSRMTLYRFGNTSSSSLWYELAYIEAKGRVRKGDRVWQLTFGSGFKCNSAVWRAIRTVNPSKEKNPWIDEIDGFPVEVPDVQPVLGY